MGTIIYKPDEWATQHQPAANTQATIARAADAGKRHRCTSVTASLGGSAAAASGVLNLRDGATGAGTILWSCRLAAPAGATATATLGDLNIIGSLNTAMTLEFAGAGGANTFETVAMTGYSDAA